MIQHHSTQHSVCSFLFLKAKVLWNLCFLDFLAAAITYVSEKNIFNPGGIQAFIQCRFALFCCEIFKRMNWITGGQFAFKLSYNTRVLCGNNLPKHIIKTHTFTGEEGGTEFGRSQPGSTGTKGEGLSYCGGVRVKRVGTGSGVLWWEWAGCLWSHSPRDSHWAEPWWMRLKLRAATGASGTDLEQEHGPVVVSKEQVLMGKKKKHLLVSEPS